MSEYVAKSAGNGATAGGIQRVPLEKLVPHPDNPNRMSRTKFRKLVHNIETTGRYEPLVVRPCPQSEERFQIINGHRRCEALRALGYEEADVIVWDVDDERTDILLATLNRLQGRDLLERKLMILRRLNRRLPLQAMAKLLPQTLGQLERLMKAGRLSQRQQATTPAFAVPVVFFVDEAQQQAIEEALSSAVGTSKGETRAARRADALARIAARFIGCQSGRSADREASRTKSSVCGRRSSQAPPASA